jgi:uncharacterized protein YoxC
MKLFQFVNFQVKISEEALSIKAFRDIWQRDKSKEKLKAQQELGFIYFFCDPRSDYMFLIDEDTRMEKIIEQEGMPEGWKPDEKVEKAMEVYKYLTTTSSSLLLQDTRELINKVRAQLKEIDLSLRDSNGKPIYTLNTVTSTIKQIPGLIKDLNEAEKAISSEIEENSKMRGSGIKKIFEDGFGF